MANTFNINLKSLIWGYFGRYENEVDSFKDSEGKGVKQRFQEACADEFEVELNPYFESIFTDTIDPRTVNSEFLTYLLSQNKQEFGEIAETDIQRKLIEYNKSIVATKGTRKGFDTLFNIFGIQNYTLQEVFQSFTFDDPEATFDDPIRTLDSKCKCPKLLLSIDTSGLDSVQLERIARFVPSIVDYMLPVTIELEQAVYYHILLTTQKNGSVTLNFNGTGDVIIDWGDNTIETFDMSSGAATHIYSNTSNNTILLTFADVDTFNGLTWVDNCIIELYLADAVLNNDTDFELDLQNNLMTDQAVLELMQSLIQRSDATKSNNILINLLTNSLSTPITQQLRDLKFDLRNDHEIDVLLGGGLTIGFTSGFNTV